MQKNKNVVNSLADVIRKNKRDAASNNEKVVLSWIKAYFISSFFVSTSQESRDSKHNFRRIWKSWKLLFWRLSMRMEFTRKYHII